ncbi:MAG: tetratricopeptide repeat protein [Candidatus Binatia bacterium]
MRRHRIGLLLLFSLWFIGGGKDSLAQSRETDVTITFYQHRVKRDPDDFFNYNQLAAAYMQKARETSDVTYYELAERALKKSLELVPASAAAAAATAYLAAVSLAQHQFATARTLAQKALHFDNTAVSAYAILGDASLELGEYEAAAEAYGTLCARRQDFSCHSRLAAMRFLHGDLSGAIEQMSKAVEQARSRGVHKEHLAWAHVQFGDLLLISGKPAQAQRAYKDALEVYPRYYRALAGQAKASAAQQHYADAIASYRKAIAVVPLPEYVAALGDLYRVSNQPEDAKKQDELVAHLALLSERNQVLYNRELARFYADHDLHLDKALDLAEKELEVRRDVYTYDVLAWALYKNGRTPEAQEAITRALHLGTQDSMLFFHAGMIAHGRGHHDEARTYLQRALRLHPRFHPLQASIAQQTLDRIQEQSARIASQEHPCEH